MQRGDELVLRGAHRLGGHRGEVGAEGPRLVPVDLLESEDVGVEALHGGREPVDVDAAVVEGAPVQDVEGRDAHAVACAPAGPVLPRCVRSVIAGSRSRVQPSDRDEIRDLLKRTAVALKEGDVPFALCGGYAAWVRGAPEPDHDADFLVAGAEAERARRCWPTPGSRSRTRPRTG